MLYETRNYLRTEEAKPPLHVMLSQRSSVGVPGKISNSIAESSEFWKQANIYNVLALKKSYCSSRPIRRTVIFSLGILEKINDECILILVLYWKKTGLLHTKISKHNII